MSLGTLAAALVIAVFLVGYLRDARVYVGLLLLLSVSVISVSADVVVLVVGGLQGRAATAMHFHRLQEVGNSGFLVAVPFMLATVLPPESRLRRIANGAWVAGLFAFATISTVAFVQPELFVSVTRSASSIERFAYASAVGRGRAGPVFRIRDVLLGSMLLLSGIVSVVALARRSIRGAHVLVAAGILLGVAAGGSALYANFVGRYPGPLDGLPFSRVSLAITVFTILSMGTYVMRFVKQSRMLDQANRELAHRRDRLAFMAFHNGTTQMPNKQALLRDLTDWIGVLSGEKMESYLCRLESPGAIEDSYGSRASDQVLVTVGRRLEELAARLGFGSGTVYHIEGHSLVLPTSRLPARQKMPKEWSGGSSGRLRAQTRIRTRSVVMHRRPTGR